MPRRVLFIAIHETKLFFRTRETYVWAFAMPVLFMYFIGTVTSRFGDEGPESKDRIAVVLPEDAGFLADQVVLRLEENGFAVESVESSEHPGDAACRLIIPPGFTDSALRGEKTVVEFVSEGDAMSDDYARYRATRAVYTVLADLVACDASDERPDAESFARLRDLPRSLTLNVESAAERPRPPTGFEQAVPGIMIMFTMLSLLTVGAVSLVVEREQGRLRRLASTPISRGELLLGKWLARMLLGVMQIAFAMLLGVVLFGMDWGPSLPMVALVLLAFASLCGCMSLLLGNLAQTEGQAIGIGVVLTNAIAALGGLWWPIEICPAWMRTVAHGLPTGWTMHAMHQLVCFRAPAAAAIPSLAALLLATIIVAGFVWKTFRYR